MAWFILAGISAFVGLASRSRRDNPGTEARGVAASRHVMLTHKIRD